MEKDFARILFLGAQGSGKTSIVKCILNDRFEEEVPDVEHPVTTLINNIETEVIDTLDYHDTVIKLQSIKASETFCVCIVIGSDDAKGVAEYIELINTHCPSAPVFLARTRWDLVQDQVASKAKLEQIFEDNPKLECSVECSATDVASVQDLVEIAQKIAQYPVAKLVEPDSDELRPDLVRALRFIFARADKDKDGYLNKLELNTIQEKCFTEGALADSQLEQLKAAVSKTVPDGATEKGFTIEGFLEIWNLMLAKGRVEVFWVLLRHYRYKDDMRLDYEPTELPNCPPDHELILTMDAINFLRSFFKQALKTFGVTTQLATPTKQGTMSKKGATPTKAGQVNRGRKLTLPMDILTNLLETIPCKNGVKSFAEVLGLNTAPYTQCEKGIGMEAWIGLWHRLATTNAKLDLAQALVHLGFNWPIDDASSKLGVIKPPKSTSDAKANEQLAVFRAVETKYSPYFYVDVVGISSQEASDFISRLSELPSCYGPKLGNTICAPLNTVNQEEGDLKSSLIKKPAKAVKSSFWFPELYPKADMTELVRDVGVLVLREYQLEGYVPTDGRRDLTFIVFNWADPKFDQIAQWAGSAGLHPLTAPTYQMIAIKSAEADSTTSKARQLSTHENKLPPLIVMERKAKFVEEFIPAAVAERARPKHISLSPVGQYVRQYGPYVSYVAVGVGVFIGGWFALSKWGYLIPKIIPAVVSAVKWLPQTYDRIWDKYFMKWVQYYLDTEYQKYLPEQALAILNRTPPKAELVSGAVTRLAPQRV